MNKYIYIYIYIERERERERERGAHGVLVTNVVRILDEAVCI